MAEVTYRGDEHLTEAMRAACRDYSCATATPYLDVVDAMTNLMRPSPDEMVERLREFIVESQPKRRDLPPVVSMPRVDVSRVRPWAAMRGGVPV